MSRGCRDGFTLIEVLAAFVILALVSVLLTRGLVLARYGSANAADTLRAENVARSLMEGPIPTRLALPGSSTGRAGDLPWTMRSEVIDVPLPKAADGTELPDFRPIRLTVTVALPRGRTLSVETIRLVKVPTS